MSSRRPTTGSCSIPTRQSPRSPTRRERSRSPALAAQWAFPAADTLAGARYAGHGIPPEDQGVSYTLRGRLESRLAALLPVVVAACVLAAVEHRWWPVEAFGLMLGIGLALDLQVYHRLLPYQPGWAALPLGAARARRGARR